MKQGNGLWNGTGSECIQSWVVTMCLLRYHLFLTTLSQSLQFTSPPTECMLWMCCKIFGIENCNLRPQLFRLHFRQTCLRLNLLEKTLEHWLHSVGCLDLQLLPFGVDLRAGALAAWVGVLLVDLRGLSGVDKALATAIKALRLLSTLTSSSMLGNLGAGAGDGVQSLFLRASSSFFQFEKSMGDELMEDLRDEEDFSGLWTIGLS